MLNPDAIFLTHGHRALFRFDIFGQRVFRSSKSPGLCHGLMTPFHNPTVLGTVDHSRKDYFTSSNKQGTRDFIWKIVSHSPASTPSRSRWIFRMFALKTKSPRKQLCLFRILINGTPFFDEVEINYRDGISVKFFTLLL